MKKVTKKEKVKKYKRPSWDEYFIEIMHAVGARGTCDRGRVGSVIVKEKRLISTGYVGAPAGCKSCDDIGHEINTVDYGKGDIHHHCVRTAHAETNAIIQAARFGISTEGATLYCMMTPCYACAKNIINAGITRVVSEKDYHAGKRSKEIFKESKVKYELLNDVLVKYKNQ
ncbi:MAG: cytidine/deoxycytidylate deaminase family protein [bacterium]